MSKFPSETLDNERTCEPPSWNVVNKLGLVTKQTTQTTTEQQLKTAIQLFFEAIRWKISINTANQNLGCAFYKGAHYKLVNLALGCKMKNIL